MHKATKYVIVAVYSGLSYGHRGVRGKENNLADGRLSVFGTVRFRYSVFGDSYHIIG